MNTPETVLGLRQGIVMLRAHTPAWARLFELEAGAIRAVLGTLALEIQHIGSTAIPGMPAKPILDIVVGVRQLADSANCVVPLTQLGYEHAHWAGLDDNVVFGKGIARTHLVHVVEYGAPKWNEYILFRDRLRSNRPMAAEYEQLKRSLCQRYADDRPAYTHAKHGFIRAALDSV